jgi:hypothetical protein
VTFENQVNPPMDEVLEHHGVKGQKWGVRRKDGGAIPSNVKRHMEKAETKFQNKRSVANSKVAQDRKVGTLNPKNNAKAVKLNTQNKKNQVELQKAGLEIFKKLPDAAKQTKVSELKKTKASTMSKGEKAAVYLLTGPIIGHYIIKKNS